MAVEQNAQKTLLEFDALYCEEAEEKWCELDEQESCIVIDAQDESEITSNPINSSLFPVLKEDLLWDDDELHSLLSKEKESFVKTDETDSSLALARDEAVEWILKVHAHYGFSPLTAILAVDYLDRFVSSMVFQPDKPWMTQLVAVTCLSLAAKVEETYVPLPIDLQVEEAEYVFEAKTIQRMELLVLSTLKWKMNPVTPLSFLDHVIRRLGLKSYVHWEFLRQCENLLLSMLADSRFIGYMPSVLATAIMLHVIHQVEPSNAIDYENQLLGVIKISKNEVNECYELISNMSSHGKNNHHKRKFDQIPNSPSDVMDGFFSCDDSSNDSWEVASSSSCISHHQPLLKKLRTQEPTVFVTSPH